jgi:DNA polymerase I-like protein with 3'-5' exonuclease and polymerase domains
MFLPVVYGFGVTSLAKHLSVSEELALQLKERIYTEFSTAINWVLDKQQIAKEGKAVKDYFGRVRQYSPAEAYLARNLVVQGPAATFCQEKMIDLWKSLNGTEAFLAFSVHDGFCAITTVNSAKTTYETMKNALEAESKLCPGLKMKVEIKFGIRLDEMRTLWKN